MPEIKIQNFKGLTAWKEAHLLVLMIYRITRNFPKDELFGITSQMRRSVVSITSNIAEGFGRNSARDKIQFYGVSRGSLLELESQILIAKDLGYINDSEFCELDKHFIIVGKLIGGLIKTAPSRY